MKYISLKVLLVVTVSLKNYNTHIEFSKLFYLTMIGGGPNAPYNVKIITYLLTPFFIFIVLECLTDLTVRFLDKFRDNWLKL